MGAVAAWGIAGRCELAAAVEGDPHGCAGTRKAIRRLRRTASGWGNALATLLTAGLQSVTERPDAARATLTDAARQLDASKLRTRTPSDTDIPARAGHRRQAAAIEHLGIRGPRSRRMFTCWRRGVAPGRKSQR
jgi:hypothetical protein